MKKINSILVLIVSVLLLINIVSAVNTVSLGEDFELETGESVTLMHNGEEFTFSFNGIWKSTSSSEEIPEIPGKGSQTMERYQSDMTVIFENEEFKLESNLGETSPARFGEFTIYFLSIKEVKSEELRERYQRGKDYDFVSEMVGVTTTSYDSGPIEVITTDATTESVGENKGIPDETQTTDQQSAQNMLTLYLQGIGIFRIEKIAYDKEDFLKKFDNSDYKEGELEVYFQPWISLSEAIGIVESLGMKIVKDASCPGDMVSYNSQTGEETVTPGHGCEEEDLYHWSTTSATSGSFAEVGVPVGQEKEYAKRFLDIDEVLFAQPVPKEIPLMESTEKSTQLKEKNLFQKIIMWFKKLFE